MTVQILRRLGVFLLTALLASVAVFWLLSVLPGDPARVALGVQASAADVARERGAMGLDRPVVVRYLDWLGGLLRGDLGTSVVTRVPVGPELGDRVQVTALLVLAAMLVAAAVAIPLGTLAALRHRHLDGAVLSGLSQVGVAVPSFLAGMVLVTVFAVRLGWFPAGGWVAPAGGPAGGTQPGEPSSSAVMSAPSSSRSPGRAAAIVPCPGGTAGRAGSRRGRAAGPPPPRGGDAIMAA